MKIESKIIPGTYPDYDAEIWTIKWGKNGNISSVLYTAEDLLKGLAQGPDVRWSETLEGQSGDEILLSISGEEVVGEEEAHCVILVNEDQVTESTMKGKGEAVCRYKLP